MLSSTMSTHLALLRACFKRFMFFFLSGNCRLSFFFQEARTDDLLMFHELTQISCSLSLSLSVFVVLLSSSCFFCSSTSLPSVFFIVFLSCFPCLLLFLTTCHETSLLSDSSEDDLASSIFPIFFEDKEVVDLFFLLFLQLLHVFRSFLRSFRFSFPSSGIQELRNRPYLLHRDHLGHRHFVRL